MYGCGQYWVVCPAPRYVYVAPATETNISGYGPLRAYYCCCVHNCASITSKISVAYKWVGGINLSPLRDLQVLIDSSTHSLAWHFKLHSQYVVVLIV